MEELQGWSRVRLFISSNFQGYRWQLGFFQPIGGFTLPFPRVLPCGLSRTFDEHGHGKATFPRIDNAGSYQILLAAQPRRSFHTEGWLRKVICHPTIPGEHRSSFFVSSVSTDAPTTVVLLLANFSMPYRQQTIALSTSRKL